MEISVIVSTWNRSQLLKEMIDSFFKAHLHPAFEFELIVVDNNSTDATKTVVEKAIRHYGNSLKYVFEKRQGLSHARNSGLNSASGRIVAFLDDDIFLTDGWMDTILKGFRDYPTAACLGGKIEAKFEGPKPSWLLEKHRSHFGFGATNFEDFEHPLVYPKYPPGSNMAFRSVVFKSIEAFKPQLGRQKSKLLSCEETELFYRMHKAGMISYYIPSAQIVHRIQQDKLKKLWIFRRFYWQGVSEVILENEKKIIEPRNIFKHTMSALSAFLREIFGDSFLPDKVIKYMCSLSFENFVAASLQAGRVVQGCKQLFLCSKNFFDLRKNKT